MNYYFLPLIDNLDTSITLANYPSMKNIQHNTDVQNIYASWSDGKKWNYLHIGTIKPYSFLEVYRSELPDQLIDNPNVFLFFCPDTLPPTSQQLFVSDHMRCKPTWRANFKISSNFTSTSFQADYQHEMVKFIKGGTLVSCSPMAQSIPGIKNFLFFTNITLEPNINEHELLFINPINKEILKRAYIYNNSFNIIELADVSILEDTLMLAVSNSIAGIPMFFSCNEDYTQMSIEHTHPPVSMTAFGNNYKFQKLVKSNWTELEKEVNV